MGVQAVQKDLATSLAVRLLDGSNAAVTGVVYSALTVIYKKQGGPWTAKTVLSAEWSEGPDGRYTLIFKASELDTTGRFVFRVTATGAEVFTGDFDVVEDWASLEAMLLDLFNALGLKASTSSVSASLKEVDETLVGLNACCADLNLKAGRLEAQAAALRRKLP